ncbi:hypothetical protein B0J12DRAFT_577399 [Macrophomina phaseolina]|uniref:Stress response protein NST1 n=1 Tax=Macrophomina phaseolina TaxID=35725 RepID=A0ABQ8G544_9PEZI|nr:hypothetical protein B0J12DRAFT_577399 [Macrophomina phaseolina]
MLTHPGAHPPPPPPPPPLSNPAFRTMRSSTSRDRIWNTSTQEERERIREFWLSLGEEERKSLVKIEKEAVLRKMKEQQKHSCSCTVCGRKRTAIEEELEVLYDAYYEELELYGDQENIPDNGDSVLTTGRPYSRRQDPRLPPDRMIDPNQPYDSGNRVEELGDEEDDEDELDEEEYSDEDEEDYSDEEEPEELPVRGPAADFSFFGNSLTVKGGILTVADDLLKNDGKKFIEMMEQLAERRMQREDQVVEHAGSLAYSSSMANHHAGHNHGPPPDDEDYDDEEDYDSQEDEYEEEEDDLDTMTEQQRMREGRRMFQIFAARMFEQRVLSAYREKVANERQQKLIEELDEENRRTAEREAKKTKDAQKRKEKKAAQKQRQAEEKARKEAEKKAEEEAAKAAEAKRQEELRKKREEQKKKKEAERKAQEEEKKRKEADKKRRLEEERLKQQEAERKAQEQKAAEKKAREDAKRKEREEREAREREAREQRAHAEQQRKDKEAKIKAEKERARKDEEATKVSQHAQPAKRTSQPTPALPPGLISKQSSAGFPSPHVQVATPNIQKAATPSKPRQSSQQDDHAPSPQTPLVFPGASKSVSPSNQIAPKTILQKPPSQIPSSSMQHPQPTSPMPPIGPPPGMHSGFGGLPLGLNAPSPMQGGMMHGLNQPRGPMFPHAPPPIGAQYPGFPAPNGMPAPPPGMNAPGMPLGRGFPGMPMPPGFGQPLPGMSAAGQIPGFSAPRDIMPSHSRQASGSGSFDSPIGGPPAHPIARPTPIQRPSSVKPQELGLESKRSGNDVDELSNHLGSSALLDDSDEPIPTSAGEVRRPSLAPSARSGRMGFGTSPLFTDVGTRGIDTFGLPSSTNSTWGTPTVPFGPPGMGGSTWGSPPMASGWPTTVGSFGSVGAPLGAPHRPSISRPVSVRLMVCQACKQLAQSQPNSDGFYDIPTIIRTIDASIRGPADTPVVEPEVVDICETEGDAHNGGGFLRKRDGPDGSVSVKFEPDTTSSGGIRIPGQAPLHGLGEIGSPIPTNSTPFGMTGINVPPANAARSSPFSASALGGVSSPSF